MANFNLPEYDLPKSWIKLQRSNKTEWDKIKFILTDNEKELSQRLAEFQILNCWPKMTSSDWFSLVSSMEDEENKVNKMRSLKGSATLYDSHQDNAVSIPTDEESAWQCYKKYLKEEKHFKDEAIKGIEDSCIRILKRLSSDTTKIEPIKGLVVGNVQSGKTANMTGLMAMSADWGWIMFIILSGTIDSLRQQSQDRIFNDLNNKNCHLTWNSLTHLAKNMEVGENAKDKNFQAGSKLRYMTVCLKNSSRLKGLIQWLQKDPNTQKLMKILVIEDEADQASINTYDVNGAERTQINRLLCNLVNGLDENDKPSKGKFKAMNYIGYTATPYANVLNDNSRESLYPRNFITTLPVSDEYFGPQQIFGTDDGSYDGLDIVRNIPDYEEDEIREIHEGRHAELPESLKDALCWFLCSVACIRYWGGKPKPYSMLVHTSQKTAHHDEIAKQIIAWFLFHSEKQFIDRCKTIWIREKRFDRKALLDQYPDYGRKPSDINDLPKFSDIESELRGLLDYSHRISFIQMDSDNAPQYNKGIHLCIDNCKNNGIVNDEHIRLLYPNSDELKKMDYSPAFIVIGGATLSRGLTLEGLVSTYFLRTVKQADTLMQMGRWFGYRVGYEVLPRIWMDFPTKCKFEYLAEMDQNFRDGIRDMEALGKTPAEFGPRIQKSPKLFRITARNRMQSAQDTALDYSGTFLQTFMFDSDATILHENLNATTAFLNSLGVYEDPATYMRRNLVWRNIDFSVIKDFINKYHFQARMKTLNDLDPLMQWIEALTKKKVLTNWNVVLAGKDDDKSGRFNFNGGSVAKVARTLKKNRTDKSILNIGVLRNPQDILADINKDEISQEVKAEIENPKGKSAKVLRAKAGLDRTPQLIIYIIDKDSKANPNSTNREDLNAPVDIAGLCINIPGEAEDNSNDTTVSIHMQPEDDTMIKFTDTNL